MVSPLRLCLVLHDHQPIGNFESVFEQAYQDSYLPLLNVFEQYPSELRLSLHTSGPLMEWLDEHHGDYLDRVARLVAAGRIEILGGPFYEPILTMIPSRDRIGQIREYTDWLTSRLGARVQGMWMPERVWEQSLTANLVAAGMRYTVLDDFHFRNAGLADDELDGYYLSEDDGRLLSIFPGSEQMRYLLPFAPPEKTIEYLRSIAERRPDAIVVFGDDGEKFGSWPETKRHVYEDGWLYRFFDALLANQSWLRTTTLAEAVDNVAPRGKVYLPDGSYREMTECALPVERQHEYAEMVQSLRSDARWPQLQRFVRGGFWRNFKVKYPEADEMYTRMMMVSQRLADAEASGTDPASLHEARRTLYRAQCNCGYWHGAFGGIYLPHLRNAVYQQLIAADNLLDAALGLAEPRVAIEDADFNLDARREVKLSNDKLVCLVAPAAGGQLYELDVRSICHNLAASLTRRPEVYHRQVQQGADSQAPGVAAIHDRVIFKQAGLDRRLQYDRSPRKSLIDHFFEPQATLDDVAGSRAEELGDFATGVYEAKLRRGDGKVQTLLSRMGTVRGSAGPLPLRITKAVSLERGSATLDIAYLLDGLPTGQELLFGVEFNFAGLPAGLDNRYYHTANGVRLGHLGSRLELPEARDLTARDEWLGIDVCWEADRATRVWAFPVESVSQSEGGFELVHQSIAIIPHWRVRGDARGQWSVTMRLTADTCIADKRTADKSAAEKPVANTQTVRAA
ncbi:MAG: alpha-amylase/4-alpha-glucanotransferase domain-containing protein [Planctomycetota bacterium]